MSFLATIRCQSTKRTCVIHQIWEGLRTRRPPRHGEGESGKIYSEGRCIRVIGKTKRGCSDEVYEGMQEGFVVTMIKCPLLGGEEGHNSSGVRVGQYGEPVH